MMHIHVIIKKYARTTKYIIIIRHHRYLYLYYYGRASKQNKFTHAMLGTCMTFSCVRNIQNLLHYTFSSLTKKLCKNTGTYGSFVTEKF